MAPWRCLLACTLLPLGPAAAADLPPSVYRRAEIAPARTSIYLGRVVLTVEPLVRVGQAYLSRYSARVMPYFFCDEAGKFRIDFPDAALRQLAAGRAVPFTGHAIRDDGVDRPMDGRATPLSPASGRIKVRVFVGRHIVLVFNTTYRLSEP